MARGELTAFGPVRTSRGTFATSQRQDLPTVHQAMFGEDLAQWIVPYSRFSDREPYKVEFVGKDSQSAIARELLKSISGRVLTSNEEIAECVVRAIAERLVWRGRVCFELHSEGDYIYVSEIPEKGLLNLLAGYVQVWVRDEAKKKWKIVLLPRRKVWEVSVSRTFGSVHAYRKMMKRLRLGGDVVPPFWMPEESKRSSVDLMAFNQMREKAIAEITCKSGWNWRNSSLTGITEFYYYYRTVSFAMARAELRDHIVRELNQLFERLAIDLRISFVGLATPLEILEIRNRMIRGEIGFAEAYKAVMHQ